MDTIIKRFKYCEVQQKTIAYGPRNAVLFKVKGRLTQTSEELCTKLFEAGRSEVSKKIQKLKKIIETI